MRETSEGRRGGEGEVALWFVDVGGMSRVWTRRFRGIEVLELRVKNTEDVLGLFVEDAVSSMAEKRSYLCVSARLNTPSSR